MDKCLHVTLDHHSLGRARCGYNYNQNKSLSIAVEALKQCRDLHTGKRIHKSLSLDVSLHVANTVLSMYSRFGGMIEARDVFDRMQDRNLFSWTTLISGYAKSGDHHRALQLFFKMQQEGFKPDRVGYLAAMKACASSSLKEDCSSSGIRCRSLERARVIHSQVSETGYKSDTFVASSLVNLFGKCGSMVEARSVFEGMRDRDVAAWNALVLGYAESGESGESLRLVQLMEDQGFAPNARTYLAALKACINQVAAQATREVDDPDVKRESLEKGKALHMQLMKLGYESDVYVASALVDLYSRCGSVEDAEDVFNRMKRPTMWAWNAMMLGYAESGDGEAAFEVFDRGRDDGLVPDARTYVALLKACLESGDSKTGIERGFSIHAQAAMAGLETNAFVQNSLLEMYARCGSMSDAFRVFSRMKRRRSTISWSRMILGNAENGNCEEALSFFVEWQEQAAAEPGVGDSHCYIAAFKACSMAAAAAGEKDNEKVKRLWLERGMAIHSEMNNKRGAVFAAKNSFIGNTLIAMYSRCGCMELAQEIFNSMGEQRTVVSWSSLILGYAEAGDPERALQFYSSMEESPRNNLPNRVTHLLALKACGCLGDFETGRGIHARLLCSGDFDRDDAPTWLVDFYGRCGRMEEAQRVFECASVIDSVAWNALISGYSRRAEVKKVAEMVELMTDEGWIADAVTGICMASTGAHAGVIKPEMMMMRGDEKNVEEWRCLVDALGRAGLVEEAVKVVEMVAGLGEERRVWRSLLGASRRCENEVLTRLVLNKLMKLDKV